MHAVEVGRLKEDLPARSGQLVSVCRDEAAELRSDQVRVLRRTHSNAYRHAFDALELTERDRRTVRQFRGNPIFQGVTKLDVNLVPARIAASARSQSAFGSAPSARATAHAYAVRESARGLHRRKAPCVAMIGTCAWARRAPPRRRTPWRPPTRVARYASPGREAAATRLRATASRRFVAGPACAAAQRS